MFSYTLHNFCVPEEPSKFPTTHFLLRSYAVILLFLALMNLGIFAKTSSFEESKEYLRSLNELMKNSSLSYHKTDKRFTPYWAAQIDGGESAAKSLAIKYGFTYLGEVSSCFTVLS